GEPCRVWPDESGTARVTARVVADLESLADVGFEELRRASTGRPDLLVHMVDTVKALAARARRPEHRRLLDDHLDRIVATGRESIRTAWDLSVLEQHRGAVPDAPPPG